MTITIEQARALGNADGKVVSRSGEKIGSIGQIYLDNTTEQPTWVTVKTGLFGTSESFVPLEDSRLDGEDIVVGYDKDTVKDAPRVDPDGNLSPQEEEELYRYYGLSGSDSSQGTGHVDTDTRTDESYRSADVDRDDDAPGTTGRDTSGPTTDDAMTRSEEQLRVGTRTEETGKARLRKYVVTENVTQTVPVSREEVRVEREPITDANRSASEAGPSISEEEHEVTLRAERPVAEKEAVPVERVRLDKETVTDSETVSDDVRREEIDVDDAGTRGSR